MASRAKIGGRESHLRSCHDAPISGCCSSPCSVSGRLRPPPGCTTRLLNDPGYTSFCDFNSTVSCTEAYLSPYGSLFGTPVAIFGVLWFAAVVALLLAGRPGTRLGENVSGYVFALSTVGLAMVLYLAYGAFVVLKAVCVLCVLTYVAVLGLFVVSGVQTRFSMTSLPQRLFKDLRAALASPAAWRPLPSSSSGRRPPLRSSPRSRTRRAARPRAPRARISGQRWSAGSTASRDSPCPWGRPAAPPWSSSSSTTTSVRRAGRRISATSRSWPSTWRRHPARSSYITKDFPIDPECNVNTPRRPAHGIVRSRGGRAARADDQQQATSSRTGCSRIRRRSPADAVKQAAQGRRRRERLRGRSTRRRSSRSRPTSRWASSSAWMRPPTFFINGVKISGGLQPQFLDAIIAHELSKALEVAGSWSGQSSEPLCVWRRQSRSNSSPRTTSSASGGRAPTGPSTA